jgi:hypothetical protein
MYKICVIFLVFYECVREENIRLFQIFGNRILKRIFTLKREEVKGSRRNCIMRGVTLYTPRHISNG